MSHPDKAGPPGKNATVGSNILAPGHGGGKNAPPAPGSGIITPLPAPHQLEEFIMPDGTVAYIKKADRPIAGKIDDPNKLKKADKPATINNLPGATGPGTIIPDPAMSMMGYGHCSVCCPSAPKTMAGQPIQPCAHQDGPAVVVSGLPGGSAAKPPAAKLSKPVPGHGPIVGLPPSGDAEMGDLLNVGASPDGGVGKKGPKPMPGVGLGGPGAGPSMSGEQKMEEARNLAGEL